MNTKTLNVSKSLPLNLTIKQVLASKPKIHQLNHSALDRPKKRDIQLLLSRQVWKPQKGQKLDCPRKCYTAPQYEKPAKKPAVRYTKTAPMHPKRKLPTSTDHSVLRVKKKVIYPKPIKEPCEKFLSYRQRKVLMQRMQKERMRLVSFCFVVLFFDLLFLSFTFFYRLMLVTC